MIFMKSVLMVFAVSGTFSIIYALQEIDLLAGYSLAVILISMAFVVMVDTLQKEKK